MQEMIKYIKEEELKGNVGIVVKYIISKTGTLNNNSMIFSIAKYHLFGTRVKWIDDILMQHTLREQMIGKKTRT